MIPKVPTLKLSYMHLGDSSVTNPFLGSLSMESRDEEDGLLVEGEHRPLPGMDGERLLQTTAAPSPCALAGLQESLTSHHIGSVTGWEEADGGGGTGRQRWVGARACLAAVTGRVPACRPPPAPRQAAC